LHGSCRHQDAPSEQVEAGAAVALPFQPLEAVDLGFGLAAAPGQGQSGAHCGAVLRQPGGERLDNADAAPADKGGEPTREGGDLGGFLVLLGPPAGPCCRANPGPADGLVFGLYLKLIGLGLNLVFGVMRIVNPAQSGFVMLGAYAAFWAFGLFRLHPVYSAVAVMLAFMLLGRPHRVRGRDGGAARRRRVEPGLFRAVLTAQVGAEARQ